MKRSHFSIFICLIFVLFSGGCKKKNEVTIDMVLDQMCNEARIALPITRPDGIRIDSLEREGSTGLVYTFTITNRTKAQIPVSQLREEMEIFGTQKYNSSKDLKILKENFVYIKVKIFDKNGEPSTEVSIFPN